ncbi:MAG: cysteine desulfurase-like protein [Gemmatimonadales bacterium]
MSAMNTVDEIRFAFPALRRTQNGEAVVYLDGPGGTQVPSAVVEVMTDYLLHHNANTHWVYPTSEETDALLLDARHVFAAFVGGAPDEIIFGANMTTLTFHAARALARSWQPGDEVIVTALDHHANVAPWQAVARDFGIVLRWLEVDAEAGTLRLDDLPRLFTPRTRLLAIGAASNALGTVSDIEAATTMAREAGVLSYVDGVHYAPHYLPDVTVLGADFFACSAYKFYGPHIGVLWGRRELLDELDVPKLEPAPDAAPDSWETGTQNHEGIVGAAAAVRWLASLTPIAAESGLRDALVASYAAMHEREAGLFVRLWDGLYDIPGVRCFGPPPDVPRTATLAFTVEGLPSEMVARALAARGCFVSNGDFYASTIADRLGVAESGMVRVGAAVYTTPAEIDRVIEGVAALIGEV